MTSSPGPTVIVTGGRDFCDVALLWRTLDDFHRQHGIHRVVEGASDDVTGPYIGADFWAQQWALARNVNTGRFRAEWKKYGRAAGPIRNQRMADECRARFVLAFPGNRGTADMVKKARAAGIEVIEIPRAEGP